MSIENLFGNLFKPEVKSAGQKLIAQDKISLTSKSDTGIQAYARTTPAFKVSLVSPSISSTSFTADCTCPAAKKERFCKHIWAVLLSVEKDYSDFLNAKINIQKIEAANESKTVTTLQAEKNLLRELIQKEYKENARLKANDYRKELYQKQKNLLNDKKNRLKNSSTQKSVKKYPNEVESALSYFSENGFPMLDGPSKDILIEAKRNLSRVFHPDKGGTHAESVLLNQNCTVLELYLKS
jgi:SWIM zinc finger